MTSPNLKFYVDGLLKIIQLGDLMRRNADYELIDISNTVYKPKIPTFEGLASAGAAMYPDRLWIRLVDEDTSEMYFGDQLMYRFDPVAGNLLFGFNDINILPTTKGGTGLEADDLADLLDQMGIKTAAFQDVGTGPNNVVQLDGTGKLPALDGSELTGLLNVPPGLVYWCAGASLPFKTLRCDGAQISRTAYTDLFSVIGTTYGIGDGATTFTLPDLRGEFIRGFDGGRGIDPGRSFGSFQADAIKSHSHDHLWRYNNNSSQLDGIAHGIGNGGIVSSAIQPFGDIETRPRNIAMLPIITY